jgi:PAS domain-containing protein
LGDLDADALGRVCDELEAQTSTVLPKLSLNADVWTNEVARLRQWHRFRAEAGAVPTLVVTAEPVEHTILGLDQWGAGPTDEHEHAARLAEATGGQPVATLTIGEGDRIVEASSEAIATLGYDAEELVGRSGAELQELLIARFGELSGAEVLAESDDLIEHLITYGDSRFHSVTVALRDETGWADQVRLLLVAASALPTTTDA